MDRINPDLSDPRSLDEGAASVEYGLLVAAIAAVIVLILFALGGIVQELFTDTCQTVATETGEVCS